MEMLTLTVFERQQICSHRKLAKLMGIDINEVVHDKQNDSVPEEVMPAENFTSKELSKTSHDIENTKYELSEADANLKSTMTAHQGREKMLPPYSATQLEGKHSSHAS